ncbi:hypothetical protein FGK63_05635 [Ruegeria sediminis]|uniref:DUF4239 domain-containing protein n=1 Tax=Ruegeria sediminis TaxID=2583820 RepID=A0ABY2X044_9RHOB|nr:hypothetical protein [Ruegeria sediminis]TMV08603.1 hypothetical protein FGK63_05635 [Ruegeria sediminis]
MPEVIDFSLWFTLAATIMLFVGSALIGVWFSRSREAAGGTSVTTLHSAILGMLALLVGFTFAMALSRHEARRLALLEEANAIGTAALRARMIPVPYAGESVALIAEYIDLRQRIAEVGPTHVDLKALVNRSNEIQETLWQRAMKAAALDPAMVPTGLYIDALNTTIDLQTTRLAASRAHIPEVVYLTIYFVACCAMGFSGYVAALETSRLGSSTLLMAFLVTAVIMLIHDLDRPNQGFIRLNQQPMLDTARSIADWQRG